MGGRDPVGHRLRESTSHHPERLVDACRARGSDPLFHLLAGSKVQESSGAAGGNGPPNGMRTLSRCFIAILFCALAPVLHGQAQFRDRGADNSLPPIDTIVSNMVAQGQWNDQVIQSFETLRLFQASNERFKQRASREVRTTFRAPDSYNSVVTKEEGSHLIRERVFDPILDAEKQAQPAKEKSAYDILPDNYLFRLVGVDACGERKCFRVAISPKRKDKFLLEGFVWIDAEDYGITKVHGSPSKRPSFWTLRTQVTRTYARVGNVWLTNRIDSDSDLFIAGHSNLSIDYSYSNVQTDGQCRLAPCASAGK